MGLRVSHQRAYDPKTGERFNAAWGVDMPHIPDAPFVIHGFARRIDAEIAMSALLKLNIDWDAPEKELVAQYTAFGREAARKVACEHLQW